MKRSSLIEGGAKLRMSVPTTRGISDNIGITRDVKCARLKKRRESERTKSKDIR